MVKRINRNVTQAEQSGIRHIMDFTDEPENVIQLTVGEIDLPTPEATKNAGIQAIKNNYTKYTANAGAEETRHAISKFVDYHYGMHYDEQHEMIVTVGASEGIDVVLRTLCEPGDEVVMASPAYPAYITSTEIAGATPVFVDTSTTGFKLTAQTLEQVITDHTKVVILNYPNNPTGTVLSLSELSELAQVIKKYDLYVITDDVYDLLVYGERHQASSIVTLPQMRSRTIVLNGLSKSHSMTGWRIGYILASQRLIEEIYKVHQTTVGGATSISQAATVAALTTDKDNPRKLVEVFEKRRQYVMDNLDTLGLTYVKPEGAFYVFINIREFGLSSWDFAIQLLRHNQLAVVPGKAFSDEADGYVRMSYAADITVLREAITRLGQAVTSLRGKESLATK